MMENGFNIQIFSASISVMKLYDVRLLPESIEKYYYYYYYYYYLLQLSFNSVAVVLTLAANEHRYT
jgi:hypothetical protein